MARVCGLLLVSLFSAMLAPVLASPVQIPVTTVLAQRDDAAPTITSASGVYPRHPNSSPGLTVIFSPASATIVADVPQEVDWLS